MKPAVRQLLFGAQWTPKLLFRTGEQGLWLDPSDFSTLAQESAGTTPAALTQPVGLILDKSGRGNNLSQATSASRPTWERQAAGWYGARADGFDDYMASTAGGGGTAGILLCAAITVNGGAGTSREVWTDRAGNSGYILRIDTLNKVSFFAGNGAAFTNIATAGTLPVGETHVVTAWDDGANLNVQIDNGTAASVARPAVTAGTAGFTMFQLVAGAGNPFNGDLHAMVYVKDTAKSATERASLKRWVGSKVGMAL